MHDFPSRVLTIYVINSYTVLSFVPYQFSLSEVWGLPRLMYIYTQWAHFPHIHFGLKLDGNKQAKLDHGTEGTQKSNGFY